MSTVNSCWAVLKEVMALNRLLVVSIYTYVYVYICRNKSDVNNQLGYYMYV